MWIHASHTEVLLIYQNNSGKLTAEILVNTSTTYLTLSSNTKMFKEMFMLLGAVVIQYQSTSLSSFSCYVNQPTSDAVLHMLL